MTTDRNGHVHGTDGRYSVKQQGEPGPGASLAPASDEGVASPESADLAELTVRRDTLVERLNADHADLGVFTVDPQAPGRFRVDTPDGRALEGEALLQGVRLRPIDPARTGANTWPGWVIVASRRLSSPAYGRRRPVEEVREAATGEVPGLVRELRELDRRDRRARAVDAVMDEWVSWARSHNAVTGRDMAYEFDEETGALGVYAPDPGGRRRLSFKVGPFQPGGTDEDERPRLPVTLSPADPGDRYSERYDLAVEPDGRIGYLAAAADVYGGQQQLAGWHARALEAEIDRRLVGRGATPFAGGPMAELARRLATAARS